MAGGESGLINAFILPAQARLVNDNASEPESPADPKSGKISPETEKIKGGPPDGQNPLQSQTTTKLPKRKQPKQRLFSKVISRSENEDRAATGFHSSRQIDITQSRWSARTLGRDRDTVFLNIKSKDEASSTRRSFRWVHHQRTTAPITFQDFKKRVEEVPDLLEEEIAVATHCLDEVQRQRRVSARGRYFEKTVHESKVISELGAESTSITAMFVSMPIFASLPSSANDVASTGYPSSTNIRTSDDHPLRTLLQYSNSLALDDERDKSQVMIKLTKLERPPRASKLYVQVPELWALVINLYTCVTCGPFSVEELCGDNIEMSSPDPKAPLPTSKDTRTIVKYTSLKGRLNDLECRQWFSLLEYIASIEMGQNQAKKDDLVAMLNRGESYEIVDLLFQPVSRERWIDIVDSQFEGTEFVHLRLARKGTGGELSLKFERKHRGNYRCRTFALAALRNLLNEVRQRYMKAQMSHASKADLEQLRSKIESLKRRIDSVYRGLLFSRYMYYAARYSLMQRDQKDSFDRATSYDRKPAWPSPRPRRTSRQIFSNFFHSSPDRSRPSSPSDSLFSSVPRSSGPLDAIHQAPGIPRIIVVNEEPEEFHVPNPVTEAPGVHRDLPADANRRLSAGPRALAVPLSVDTSSTHPDIDLEAQQSTRNSRLGQLSRSSTAVEDHQSRVHQTPEVIFRAKQQKTVRRHSMYVSSPLDTAIFSPSPPRRPLHPDDDAALRTPSRPPNIAVRPTLRRQQTAASLPPDAENTKATHEASPDSKADACDIAPDLIGQAAARISGAIARLHPFFEWQRLNAPRTKGARVERSHGPPDKPDDAPTVTAPKVEMDAPSILDFVDEYLKSHAVFTDQRLNAEIMDYNNIPESSFEKVADVLNTEQGMLMNLHKQGVVTAALEADSSLHEAKEELALSVYMILRCFVTLDRHAARVIQKIWGIIFEVSKITPKKSGHALTTMTHRHEVKFILAAATHIQKLQVDVSDLLKSVRPDSGDDETAITYTLCEQLVHAFANIIVYLLCVWRATTRFGVEASNIDEVLELTRKQLSEAEWAFLRMRKRIQTADDAFVGTESLQTADTLLVLLLSNALELSDGESKVVNSPRFDLRYIYSKYTSECIERAKRHASVRIYRDVKHLIEEVRTIQAIIQQQRHVYIELFNKREAKAQRLDLRVKQRTLEHLKETALHFEKLLAHATQAAEWNQHFIDIRGEDNNKAIYVFTAVTVIFLPLSFVAGLLGMNTLDVRNTADSQWLFWAVAIPFTVCILVICIGIVQYKFLLRKRLNGVLRSCTGRR